MLSICVRPMPKLFAVLLAAIAGARRDQAAPEASATRRDSADGRRYLQALTAAIRGADRIVVTEHSFDGDAIDTVQQKSLEKEPLIYAVRELTAKQIADFEASMAGLNPAPPEGFSPCIFAPHHTVTFYRSGKNTSTMRICFECDRVEWEGTDARPPGWLYAGLAQFVSSLGMQPHRDWEALAQAAPRTNGRSSGQVETK